MSKKGLLKRRGTKLKYKSAKVYFVSKVELEFKILSQSEMQVQDFESFEQRAKMKDLIDQILDFGKKNLKRGRKKKNTTKLA